MRVPYPVVRHLLATAAVLLLCGAAASAQGLPGRGLGVPQHSPAGNPNDPGILDPVLFEQGRLRSRIPQSHQISNDSELLNIVGGINAVKRKAAVGQPSATGSTIQNDRSPNRVLEEAVDDLDRAAQAGQAGAMQAAAQRAAAVLLGTTTGELFDGFAMLNHDRGAWLPGHLPGHDRMKALRDSGLTTTGPDGLPRKIWEADVRLLWYDDELDSDTHFLRVPEAADDFDILRVNYTIYASSGGDFAPSVLLDDVRAEGSNHLPFKGFDATWVPLSAGEITEMTLQYPPLGQIRGLQVWDWRATPWRSNSIQLVREVVDAHSGAVELDPRARALVAGNAARDLASVAPAAPERKILTVVEAVQAGATPAQVAAMLNQPQTGPLGVWDDWVRQLADRTALPEEALQILALEGIFPDQPGPRPLGPYDLIAVFANHEMRLLRVDDPPAGALAPPRRLPGAFPGETLQLKVINLDGIAHRVQVHEAGPPLHFDIKDCHYAPAGGHSLEIFSWKPWYGAPKAAELQWRAGWGFRPHADVIEQFDVFPRLVDRLALQPYTDGAGRSRAGWQEPAHRRGGDFVFDPPTEWIGKPGAPSALPLREANGAAGLLLGTVTPGYGTARVCDHPNDPPGSWCSQDLAAFNPYGELNFDSDGDGVDDQLRFPAWLRNPDPAGGDLIPSTLAWEPFLYLNPSNGTVWLDPANPDDGLWADRSYAFGEPVPAASSANLEVVAKRGLPQALWIVDGLLRSDGSVPVPMKD